MSSTAAATPERVRETVSTWLVVRRPSATFLVLAPADAERPVPGVYGGEIELAGVEASCSITVPETGAGREVWCQPQGRLPRCSQGERATLRFRGRADR